MFTQKGLNLSAQLVVGTACLVKVILPVIRG